MVVLYFSSEMTSFVEYLLGTNVQIFTSGTL